MNYNRVFDALTGQEFAVIYWSCQGLTYGEIEEKFGYGVSWIQKRASSTHRKLGIDHLLPRDRETILDEEICPALMAWIENHPDKIKRLPPPLVESVQSEEGRQGMTEIVLNKPNQIINIPQERRGRVWRRSLVFLGMVALVGYGAFQIGRNSTSISPVATLLVSPVPTATTVVPTKEAATQSATAAPSPTVIPTETVAPTATQPPTANPFVPPADGVLFQDGFDNAMSSEWVKNSGNWLVADGKLTVLPHEHFKTFYEWITISKPEWKNYAFSVDIDVPRSNSYTEFALAIRDYEAQDMLIGVEVNSFLEIYWSFIGNYPESSTPITGIDRSLQVLRNSTIQLEVQGDVHILRVDGRELQRVVMAGYDAGGIGIGVDCTDDYLGCPKFDNVKVTYLP